MVEEATVPVTETATATSGRVLRGLVSNWRRVRRGLVTSGKMITVTQTGQRLLNGQTVKWSTEYKAHDDLGKAGVGDIVDVMEYESPHKEKSWRLYRIVKKAKSVMGDIRKNESETRRSVNSERVALIKRKVNQGLSDSESDRLEQLQHVMRTHVNQSAPLPAPLADGITRQPVRE